MIKAVIKLRLTNVRLMFLTSNGGWVVRWCWVTCNTGASYYIWLTVGQGSTVLSVGAGRIVWIIFLSSIISPFLPFSGNRPDIDWNTISLGHWIIQQRTNQIFPPSLRPLARVILAGICTCAGSACDYTFVFLIYGPCIGWMDRWLAILRPSQQYFSHIRTTGGR